MRNNPNKTKPQDDCGLKKVLYFEHLSADRQVRNLNLFTPLDSKHGKTYIKKT